MLTTAPHLTTKGSDMIDCRDRVEAFSAAFDEAFGIRAMEVAQRQRDQADGRVRERWQSVIDRLPDPAFTCHPVSQTQAIGALRRTL